MPGVMAWHGSGTPKTEVWWTKDETKKNEK
jgi:hypothetical protein